MTKHTGWTFELCAASAANCAGRGDWSKTDNAAYQAALRLGWIDTNFPSRKPRQSKWTPESCLEIAKKYSFQKQWQQNHPASFYAAYRGGWLESCTAHMGDSPRAPSDNNCIYIWRSQIPSVYKIGVTSQRLGTERIDRCTKNSSMRCLEIVLLESVDNALSVERQLLDLGAPFTGATGDGRTEFRVLSEFDLQTARELALAA